MMSSSVVLPHPLGPTRQTNSPSAMRRSMLSSTCTSARGVRNHLDTPSTISFAAGAKGGWTSLAVISPSWGLYQPGQVRSTAQEADRLRARDEALESIKRQVACQYDALPGRLD